MIAALAALAMAALPAQPGALGKLDRHVLDAINECEREAGEAGDIQICARRPGTDVAGAYTAGVARRYRFDRDRLAEEQRGYDRRRTLSAGASGTGSCSAVGGGGGTGCTAAMIRAARGEP